METFRRCLRVRLAVSHTLDKQPTCFSSFLLDREQQKAHGNGGIGGEKHARQAWHIQSVFQNNVRKKNNM